MVAPRGPTACMFTKKNCLKYSSQFTIRNGYLVTIYSSGFEACLRFRLRRLLAQTCQYPDTYPLKESSTSEYAWINSRLRTIPLVHKRFLENLGYHNFIKILVYSLIFSAHSRNRRWRVMGHQQVADDRQ